MNVPSEIPTERLWFRVCPRKRTLWVAEVGVGLPEGLGRTNFGFLLREAGNWGWCGTVERQMKKR